MFDLKVILNRFKTLILILNADIVYKPWSFTTFQI